MKTVILYETSEELALYLSNDDMTKYEGIFANCHYDDPEKAELESELAEIQFDSALTTAEAKQHILDGANLVHCGFMF